MRFYYIFIFTDVNDGEKNSQFLYDYLSILFFVVTFFTFYVLLKSP